MNTKTRSDAFSQKISEEQHAQLIHWLAEHNYDEVLALIKADPPSGFGIEVSKPTLSRFYQDNFQEIDSLRQRRIHDRVVSHYDVIYPDEDGMRNFLHEEAALRLQEHLCDFLAQPITSVSDLKALASISKVITQLKVDIADPHQKKKTLTDIASLFAQMKKQNAAPPTSADGI